MSDSVEDISRVREETYQRKLKENIQLKQRFYDAGLESEQQFSKDIPDQDELQSLKRETLALYELLKTVPFKPQRDDLIGASLADHSLGEQVDNLKYSIDVLAKLNNENIKSLKYIESLIFNLNLLNNMIISREKVKRDDDSNGELELDRTLEDLHKRESKLIGYTKQIIFQYLVESNTFDDKHQKRAQYLKMLEDLLNNITSNDNKFIEIPKDLQNDSVLRQLLLGKVIQQQQNFKYIKLNGFGL